MLALLDEQQAFVTARAADEVLRSVALVDEQTGAIRAARQQREALQSQIAQQAGVSPQAPLANLISLIPAKFRVAVETLWRENNQLLIRVQQRARKNHLLLTRSLQLMQEFINDLTAAASPRTYDGGGHVQAGSQPGLYEAIG
jgi:flagellar biosynthesis/type III secretory pathway chaperone